MMFTNKNTNTHFGFRIESDGISQFAWDEQILQDTKAIFGQESVETSLKFADTNE